MVKNRYWNSNFRPSKGAKIHNFLRIASLDPHRKLQKSSLKVEFTERWAKFQKGGGGGGGDDVRKGGDRM